MSAGGCGGGAPLLHPAQVLAPGVVSAGAGISGQPVLRSLSHASNSDEGRVEALLQERAVAPGVAPWVSARAGITGNNEAGLTYSGRGLRLDGRHAFDLSRSVSLSTGLGGEVLLTGRLNDGPATGFAGGGLDLPLLIGWTSTARIYSVWIGPRAGIAWLRGDLPAATATAPPEAFSAQQIRAGLVAGIRVGFRHVHVALEVGGDYHHVTGQLAGTPATLNQLTGTPGGALWLAF